MQISAATKAAKISALVTAAVVVHSSFDRNPRDQIQFRYPLDLAAEKPTVSLPLSGRGGSTDRAKGILVFRSTPHTCVRSLCRTALRAPVQPIDVLPMN